MKLIRLVLGYLWTLWGVLFFNLGILIASKWKSAYTNCLIWALQRWTTEDGYMKVVHSRHSKLWPHFTFVDSSGVESEMQPVKIPRRFISKRVKWRKLSMPVLFKGKINKL